MAVGQHDVRSSTDDADGDSRDQSQGGTELIWFRIAFAFGVGGMAPVPEDVSLHRSSIHRRIGTEMTCCIFAHTGGGIPVAAANLRAVDTV